MQPPASRQGPAVVALPDEVTSGNAEHVKQDLAAAFSRGPAPSLPTVFCDSTGMQQLGLVAYLPV